MITKYQIFEAQAKEDGPYKYKIGDIVVYRPNKKSYKKISKLMWKVVGLDWEYITIFTRGTRSIRKNAYNLESGKFKEIARESEIRKMRGKEIEQYKFEEELNKYNI